ncbi:MAG: class I tRNA ligase family protein, partial [Candidatus Pacebacteria bacterium]|nr:class I tRNA ligase family protein [Candidatus Paceibacterota bacterium]
MKHNFVKQEEKILEFWKKNKIFEKSLEKKGEDFVFYDGPITVNAKPGIHHVLARVFKDIIPRFKTMQGYYVQRKNGWDTHGLPVELEVEKKLKLESKKQIQEYGIAEFNEQCRKSIDDYLPFFQDLTERIAYWVDMDNPYITYQNEYIETVWQIIKQISDKGLLEQDYKVVPYCPRCGTGLSSHEVAQGYKKIKEPAIYVKIKLKTQNSKLKTTTQNSKLNTYLLIWTTTPWTLPGNVAIAVNPKITYILAKKDKEYLIIAKERKEVLRQDFEVLKEIKGKELVGLSYEPIFDREELDLSVKDKEIYKVLPADFVNTEEGTGLVHIAPAFGQDDMELIK